MTPPKLDSLTFFKKNKIKHEIESIETQIKILDSKVDNVQNLLYQFLDKITELKYLLKIK